MLRLVAFAMFLALLPSVAEAQDAIGYKAACGACHPSVAALARKIAGATHDEKKRHLMTFLQSHHPPDPAKLEGIVGYLLPPPK